MPKPRYAQVSLEVTPYYHCYSRRVRRAFLCGLDRFTKTSYEHRKQWLEDRIYTASTTVALDLCTYAIISSHYHVVQHVNKPQADAWGMNKSLNKSYRDTHGNLKVLIKAMLM